MQSNNPTPVSRRRFLKVAAATWATVNIVPRHLLGGPGQTPPSAKVNLAGVGFGHLKSCDQEGFKIVALCDVDDVYAKKAYDRWPQAESDTIDAVHCATSADQFVRQPYRNGWTL